MSSRPSYDSFKREFPELFNFLAGWFPDADYDGLDDDEVARRFASRDAARTIDAVAAEGARLLALPDVPWAAVGDAANRYFADGEEARAWLRRVLEIVAAVGRRSQGGS